MKKRNQQKFGALLLALVLSLSLALPVSAAESSPVAEAGKDAATAAMNYGQATQIAWAVWRDGDIIASGREGQPREDPGASHLLALAAASQTADLYGAGSVSKIYTTAAVLQLAEAGKLDLDQPVVKYLPQFKMADPRYKDITVRMLLNHSSGLMGSSMGSALLFEDASAAAVDRLLDRLSVQRLKADPGAYSVYCNDGFTLAQLVVETVSDTNFQDYLRTHILAPAGLENTYFPDELVGGAQRGRVVPVYQGEDPRPLPMDCLGVVGTGGIYATAEDLAALGGALTGETLLKKASLEAMAAPEYARGLWPEGDAPDALAFGLGWDSVKWHPFAQSGVTALVKGGDTQYYHAGLVVLPEHRLAAAVLSSGGVSTYNEMAATQMLIAALKEEGVAVDETAPALPEARPAAMPQELLDGAGWYGAMMVYRVELSRDGTLTMRYPALPQVPEQTFSYHSDGTFRDEAGTSALRLVKEDNGQTYLCQRAFTELPGLGGLPTFNYAAVKLPENDIAPALQEQWASVMGGAVLPMNERYSSQIYASMGALLQADSGAAESAPGYVGSLRIADETHARYEIQVPGTGGRDGSDIELRRDGDGVLWFYQSNGGVYMDMNAAPALSTGRENRSVCTIQPDGFARWYRIGSSAAGKAMTVQMPENAGFWVYNPDGGLAASSVLWGDTAARLAEGGLIAFAGDPGAQFELTFS